MLPAGNAAGTHLREMQSAAAVSMLHTQVLRQRQQRDRMERAQQQFLEAEGFKRKEKAEYSHTNQLKKLELEVITNQIKSQRSWLEEKEATRRKPLTDVEKKVLKARAKIKCWPSFMATLDNELTHLQGDLLPSAESKLGDMYVLIKSTMTRCEQQSLESENASLLTALAADDASSNIYIRDMLQYVEFFSSFLTEHTRLDSQSELDRLTPCVENANHEFDAANSSAEPLRARAKQLRGLFESAMKPIRYELEIAVEKSIQAVQTCENEQAEAICGLESEIQIADENILSAQHEREKTEYKLQTVLSQTEMERVRISKLQEDLNRIEEERLRTAAGAKVERWHMLLRRRVLKALISARKERQEREAAQLEDRVDQLSRHVAATDARWASDEFVRRRFRRSLLRYRLAGSGASDEELDAEMKRQEASGSVTESDVFEAVKQLFGEREGGEEVDVAEARARVQCRFPYVWAARIDAAVDLDAVFDRACEAAAASAAAATSKGGAGRLAHVRWLLGEYGVSGEEMAGLTEEELEQMLEVQQQAGRLGKET
jgi:hypothetical protein